MVSVQHDGYISVVTIISMAYLDNLAPLPLKTKPHRQMKIISGYICGFFMAIPRPDFQP